mmetsp:Transcript_21137/g.49525  ORF Transcript_21137/g.49525 Transcript_21137/m.49525 type:complete len:487 (-) Transcript_21137:672-2132(-)
MAVCADAYAVFIGQTSSTLALWKATAALRSATSTVTSLPDCSKCLPEIHTSDTLSRLAAYTRVLMALYTGVVAHTSSSLTAIMSACLPLTSDPVLSPRPRARAPLRVAICRAVAASTAVASEATALASTAAVFISAIISRELLDEAPSVPMATFTPPAASFATGQKPEASLRLDVGQCTTLALASANMATSSSVQCVMWAATSLCVIRPILFKLAAGRMAWGLRCAAGDSAPASLWLHSSAVSWRWMWMGVFISSANSLIRIRLSSPQVYGACGAHANDTRSLPFFATSRPLAKYSSPPLAYAEGKSRTTSPRTARMPNSSTALARESEKKYMSLKHVVPPRTISAMPSRRPATTKSGATRAPSMGQISVVSHSIRGLSSHFPRIRVIDACVCALTRPGASTWSLRRWTALPMYLCDTLADGRISRITPLFTTTAWSSSTTFLGSTGTIHLACTMVSTTSHFSMLAEMHPGNAASRTTRMTLSTMG